MPGDRYLAFIDLVPTDGLGNRWSIDTCGNSADLTKATRTIRQVRALAGDRR